ncbi:MAG: anthranilate synthase component I, partial [Alphaproteobacteria bacterium]
MRLRPAFEEFAATYGAGRPQIVSTRLVADLETPVSAYIKLARGRPNSFLFESVEGGTIIGRYSFIGIEPDLIWQCRGDRADITRDCGTGAPSSQTHAGALESLRQVLSESRIDLPPDLPPMASALVGYMAYDAVRLMERLPDANPDVLGLPDAMFLRPTVIAVFDRLEDQITLFTPVWPATPGTDARAAYDAAEARLGAAVERLNRPLPVTRTPGEVGSSLPPPVSNVTRETYHAMVEKAKEYIRAGDAFQIVPSQRFRVPFELPPLSLYRALRRLNPSPFLFYLDFGGFSIVGSSPEILVRVRNGRITIR